MKTETSETFTKAKSQSEHIKLKLERLIHRYQKRIDTTNTKITKLRKSHKGLKTRLSDLHYQLSIVRLQSNIDYSSYADSWRGFPITSLRLDSVEGIGVERRRRLIESFPFMGDLEHLRVTHGISSLPSWSDKLRRRLEDRLLGWLRMHAASYIPPRSADHVVPLIVTDNYPEELDF